MTPAGLAELKSCECLRLRVYDDATGKTINWPKERGTGTPTIGYGHALTPHEQGLGAYANGITQEYAETLLRMDLLLIEKQVEQSVKVSIGPNQLDALKSFAYNVGLGAFQNSTLLRKLNAGEYDSVPSELRRWVYAGGKPCKGLVIRREREIATWNKVAQAVKPHNEPSLRPMDPELLEALDHQLMQMVIADILAECRVRSS